MFEGGLADPMPVRSGVLEGLEDVVQVPDDLPPPATRERRPGEVSRDSDPAPTSRLGRPAIPRKTHHTQPPGRLHAK